MPTDFDLIQDDTRQWVLRRPGMEDAVGVRIRRAFPWTRPAEFISIRNSEGKELLLIETLESLSPALRAKVEQALADTSLIPRITHIHGIDTRFEHQQWSVMTDRGPAEFRVQEREDLRMVARGRWSIKDADGNVYELSDVAALDPASRQAVEKVL